MPGVVATVADTPGGNRHSGRAVPEWDAEQQAVLAHRGGPLLILGGPGTGKTTLLIETVADRVSRGEVALENVLVLTGQRRSAAELRRRIALRLGRTSREPLARTFHSYAFGVLCADAIQRGEPPPRLLTSAEQDVIIRELLRGDLDRGATGWPERLRPALPTRGFARELREFLQQAVQRGLTPDDVARLGRQAGRDDWVAIGRFAREYSQVTALRDAAGYDPAELILAATALLQEHPQLLESCRVRHALVVVDEYEETDPAQRRLLRAITSGAALVIAADPDQSVYGFRGADPLGVREFLSDFADQRPRVVVLGRAYRGGPALLAAVRRLAERLPVVVPPGVSAAAYRGLAVGAEAGAVRALAGAGAGVAGAGAAAADGDGSVDVRAGAGADGDGSVDVRAFATPGAQAAYIAYHLRHAHLVEGLGWTAMAVLVRSAAQIPPLRRALTAAGVPVRVSEQSSPIVDVPIVRHLLLALRIAAGQSLLDVERAPTAAASLAEELVAGPIGRADPLQLRRLRIALRRLDRAAGGERSSAVVLAQVLNDPRDLEVIDEQAAAPALRVARAIAAGRRAVTEPAATAETVLWEIWNATGLATELYAQALSGGAVGAAADRDLDAVMALFAAASRYVDRLPRAGAALFADYLLGQEIPTDTLAARAPEPDGVDLLTAHAAKSREWDVVVLAGVQEGVWPDLRRRGSLLGLRDFLDVLDGRIADAADRGPGGSIRTLEERSAALAEERRLCYLAASRARRKLIVTAVSGDQEIPSRFLDDIDPLDADERPLTRPPRGLDLPSLLGDLRRAAETADDAVARRAAGHLAQLAAAGIPGAAPDGWYGLPAPSTDQPLRRDDEPVPVSPSRLELFTRCPLRWLLESCGGRGRSSASQVVGTAVHRAAATFSVDVAQLRERLDAALADTDLGTGWFAAAQRDRAAAMVERLAAWMARNPRRLLAVERDFQVTVGRALLTGRVDRLEQDDDGRLYVVDLKTGRRAVRKADLAEHPQLGAYQVAVVEGAFDEGRTPAGAALLFLDEDRPEPVEWGQAPLEAAGGSWAHEMIMKCAEGMAAAVFDAVANDGCRFCPVRICCPLWVEGAAVTG